MTSRDSDRKQGNALANSLMKAYERIVLAHPIAWLVAVALLLGTLATGLSDFRIEASSDSLLLESDESLEYYRSIRARYGSDDFLVLTYTPQQDLFSEQVLADLRELRDAVAAIEQVDSVVSMPLPSTINAQTATRASLPNGSSSRIGS